MIRPILQVPDQRLFRTALPVSSFTEKDCLRDLVRLIADLIDTRVASNAAGLAAPQIGECMRVVSVSPGIFQGFSILINPVITAHGQNLRTEAEGCMSVGNGVPRFDIPRYDTVTVEFHDRHMVPRVVKLRSFAARLAQHEIDHLDGKVIGQ